MDDQHRQEQEDLVHELEAELSDMGVVPQHTPAPRQEPTPTSPATAAVTQTPPVTAPTSAAASTERVETPVQGSVAAPLSTSVAAAPIMQTPDAADTTVPPVPTAPTTTAPQHNEVMGQVLTQAIQQGKEEVPHAPDPLVAKPTEIESWRVFKIMSEFVEGFEILRKYGLAATFFGSVRRSFADRFYDEATALAGRLAKSGFAIITGGSAGIMEAANKGAYEAGGASVGLNIRLDASQGMNQYLTDSMTFEHFFVRKVMLTFASEVYVYFPGGFGTLDEFTEIVTLVQTQKIRKIPIVLYGKEYWEPFANLFNERLYSLYGAIDQRDMDLYRIVDSVDEAYDYIINATGGKDVRRV